ncbi:uncharacterized protein LOC144027111 [Festucalex cinctus]
MAFSNRSVRSSRTGHSSASVVSAAQARAKAEAAKVRASYATKEAQLKVEKARSELEKAKLDAELEVLTLHKEADAAVAEAKVLEEAEAIQEDSESRQSLAEKEKIKRTSEYVQSQIDNEQSPRLQDLPSSSRQRVSSPTTFVTWHQADEDNLELPPVSSEPKLTKDIVTALTNHNISKHDRGETKRKLDETNYSLNPFSTPFTPQCPTPASISQRDEPFAQYMARRDLITSGLYQFDDRPENYRAWYSSFTGATAEVQLSPTQLLDLMTKWLGKESSEQVKRIRSVYVNNPLFALRKAWERLNECYAAPEIIEKSLFNRLDSFPKITAKDNVMLRELGDLLQEIQGAKEDGYLPGLLFLDTSRGIGPVVDKLPYGLQERWMSHGSQYKEENQGCFPPFEYFCKFICKEAKKRNDPSFNQHNSQIQLKSEKGNFKSSKQIAVHKTDISPLKDLDKNCPLHNKPHRLENCRTFRKKPHEERKAFLKERGICFKCCASDTHLAKDCQSTVKCSECNRTSHVTAMHYGPSSQTNEAPPLAQENGGEEEKVVDVTTSCTDVCGLGQLGRSCSKICLARVYPKGHKNKAIKAYVILDDQSNRSLARTEFFEIFNIKNEPLSYNLKTCSGIVETWGKMAEGFQIESLDGSVVVPLPPLIECQDIPNNRSEIPTPGAVLHQPHLQSIAKYIPELDPNAEILLLLGRDILQAHKVRQRINGPHNAPFAQRLDLGWVVVGEVCLGPDLNNTLIGVLLRFRKGSIAVMADIQQMFHCFRVQEDHRNFLRFLWHKDNDVNKEVIDYRMKVHVFGNSPSPAVAVYGLRKAICAGAKDHGADTVNFVWRHFYVDDGLISVSSPAEAIDLLRRTQASLAESNLRLHKFASNSPEVMQAFSPEDCAPSAKDLNLDDDEMQSQRKYSGFINRQNPNNGTMCALRKTQQTMHPGPCQQLNW